MEQAELVERYRRLRGIAADIQQDSLSLVPYVTMVDIGRRLGVVRHGDVVFDAECDAKMAYDLAIHTSRPGRSRAIDRYARNASFRPDDEEFRVLKALQVARFSVVRFESRHPVAGGVAHDLLEDQDFHLMDVAIGLSAEQGDIFVGRFMEIDGFRMSCFALLPGFPELLTLVSKRLSAQGKGVEIAAFQDPRCATAFFRAAIELGAMQRCVTLDPVKAVPTPSDVAAIQDFNDHLPLGLPALMAVY